jgi:phosphatidylserine synthase
MGMLQLGVKDLVTLLSLVSAMASITLACDGEIQLAGFCVWLAWVFDGLDGVVARWTRYENAIGPHLDNTVDLVSSAIAPAALAYAALRDPFGRPAAFAVACVPALCGVLRHARGCANPDTATNYWIGLPRTYSGMAIAGLLGSHVFRTQPGRLAIIGVILILPALGLTTIAWQGRHHSGLKPHQVVLMLAAFSTFTAGLALWALGHGLVWFHDAMAFCMVVYAAVACVLPVPEHERVEYRAALERWKRGFLPGKQSGAERFSAQP